MNSHLMFSFRRGFIKYVFGSSYIFWCRLACKSNLCWLSSGAHTHQFQGLINKAVQCVVSSYAKHAEKRKVLAALLDQLTNDDDNGDGAEVDPRAPLSVCPCVSVSLRSCQC